MLVYYQLTGHLLNDFIYLGTGYSGKSGDKNNPSSQSKKDLGPIPRGLYSVSNPFTDFIKGPLCFRLTPSGYNEMFGRDGFLIHGDSKEHPGEASEGCIILDETIRLKIQELKESILTVV